VGLSGLRARPNRAVIVVLSDEQLERIEDALTSAKEYLYRDDPDVEAVNREVEDALGVVKAARALLAA
jgi:hypothetical protein